MEAILRGAEDFKEKIEAPQQRVTCGWESQLQSDVRELIVSGMHGAKENGTHRSSVER